MSEFMRERYCTAIENALTSLAERLRIRVDGNLTDAHVYAEDIMASILNPTYDLDLINANISAPNSAGIDLIDRSSRVIIQVSADTSRSKIQSTLRKKRLRNYTDYHLQFMFLAAGHPHYKRKPFENPYRIQFDVDEDVLDISSLMSHVRHLPIERLETIHDSIRKEIRLHHSDPTQAPLGLAAIVRSLMTANPDERQNDEPVAFRIEEKIQMNSLTRSAQAIQELSAVTYPLVSIYNEYEREGIGRARSIFHHLQTAYREHANKGYPSDDVYLLVIHTIVNELRGDGALREYTIEDIEYYAEVVVVDAFMRCKLFDGPDVWKVS